jgi:hypothetical protein
LQNRESGGFAVWQEGQDEISAAPQWLQKRAAAGLSFEHPAQIMARDGREESPERLPIFSVVSRSGTRRGQAAFDLDSAAKQP